MKILQLPNPGNGGRLGNQLFTIASTIGLSLRYGFKPHFPSDWRYRKHFPKIPDEWFGEMEFIPTCAKESCFEYDPKIERWLHFVSLTDCSDNISGYLQSPKYWQGYEDQIRHYLMPAGADPCSIPMTSVHIRRGDYVDNPNYIELPMSYYLNAIDGLQYEPRFFSDHAAFARFHFGDCHEANEIDTLRCMIAHSRHVVSNSTFSWWAAYLSGSDKVIRPDVYFSGELAKRCSTVDFWPANWWTCLTDVKYDLQDVTFVIPVTFDHPDRLENVRMVVDFLNLHFNTNILIGEVNTTEFAKHFTTVHYDMPTFHRTKVINDLTRRATTPIVFNWDADVIVPPYQIYKAVESLRNGADIAYPYDGTFYMVDRRYMPKNLNSLRELIGPMHRQQGALSMTGPSYGGAVGYNVHAFFKAGGENENFVNYGPEDQERWRRFNLLCDVTRVAGAMYHINHWRGLNSSFSHPDGISNQIYWDKICRSTDEQFIEHIKTFTWAK